MTRQISRRSALGLIAGVPFIASMARAQEATGLSGRVFGTGWRLVTSDAADMRAVAEGIGTVFADVDRRFSPYRADSLISRFNAQGQGSDLRDAPLARVTRAALDIADQSGGAFDPTVGPLVARWGFGPIREGGAPDWRGIAAEGDRLGKAHADLTLDLCGIAKGWALDEAMRHLRQLGLRNVLFDLGGELAALGTHPSGRSWQVAVEGTEPVRALRLTPDRAVATSGIAAQSYRLGAHSYGHIIDPRHAAPAQGRLRAVSVVAGNAMTADGWATALFAAGDRLGPEMAADLGLAALFLSDGLDTQHTPAMAGYLI